jgi:lysozyme
MGNGVNDHHFTNQHGLRLLQHFEGAPRLKARLCEGGRWELSYGVTFYPDGRPVLEGDTCTEDEALAIFRHALIVFEDVVKRHVKVPLNSNQFSACVVFAYNIGEERFASSTVLRHINASRFDDAADAFGMWIYATMNGHKQAMRGLLRRRYAEAVTFMGYSFEVACADDAIALVRQRPPNNVGTDRVLSRTSFKDVLSVAQRFPLPSLDDELVLTIPASPPQAAEVAQRQPDPARSPAAGATIKASVGGSSEAAPVKPTVPAPQPVPTARPAPAPVAIEKPPVAGQDGLKSKSPNTTAAKDVAYKIDPNAGLKPLEESDRAKGYVVQQIGLSVIKLGSLGAFGSTVQAGSQIVQGDPVISNVVMMAFVAIGIALIGYVIKVYGDWKRKRGEQKASQGLF